MSDNPIRSRGNPGIILFDPNQRLSAVSLAEPWRSHLPVRLLVGSPLRKLQAAPLTRGPPRSVVTPPRVAPWRWRSILHASLVLHRRRRAHRRMRRFRLPRLQVRHNSPLFSIYRDYAIAEGRRRKVAYELTHEVQDKHSEKRFPQRVGLDPQAVLSLPSKTTIRGLGCRAPPAVVTPGGLRSLQS